MKHKHQHSASVDVVWKRQCSAASGSCLDKRPTAELQQVRCLVAANQMLACQIQEELDRKCVRERRQLDGHLRTVSLLQRQISESLSAQAEIKLQLLSVKITVTTFSTKCHKEHERRGHLEAELSDLRRQEEELRLQKLPQLRRLLADQTHQQGALQTQHQQDLQGLLAQVSRGVAVQSSHLMQHVDKWRGTASSHDRQLVQQEELRSSALILEEEELRSRALILEEEELRSRALILEEEELRSRALILEEELQRQQSLNALLEDRHVEQAEHCDFQLVALQQRAESVSRGLDCELQAAVQQAAEHQALLDVNNTLHTELRGYRKLLDGFLSQPLKFNPTVRSFPDTSRKVTLDRGITAQGRNFWTMEVQTVSKGHVCTVKQTPAVIVLLETVTTKRLTSIHNKKPQNSPLALCNTSHLIDSIHDPGTLRTGAPIERTTTGLDKGAVNKSKTESPETAGVTNTGPGGETEIKQAPYLILQTTTELMTATNQIHHLNGHDPATGRSPAIVTSVKLETLSESARDEDYLCCRSEEDQGEVNPIPDKKLDREEKKEENQRAEEDGALRFSQNMVSSGLSNSKQNQTKDPDTQSTTETSSNCSQVRNNSPEILHMVELEGSSGSVNGAHDTNKEQVDLLSTAEQKKYPSLTDSGIGLSYCDFEELPGPVTSHGFLSPTETVAGLSPEICPIPLEAELIMSDQVFFQADLKKHMKSPNDSDPSVSPVEMKEKLSLNSEEEDEEVYLSLTEANANVRPVETYILSTKEDWKSSSLRGEIRMNEPSTGSQESPLLAKEPVTNHPGPGGLVLYGGSPTGASLLREGNTDNSSVASDVLMRLPESGRSSSRVAEEGLVPEESHGCKSRVSLSGRGSNEGSSVKTAVPSQPRAKQFGSRGSGEWTGYGLARAEIQPEARGSGAEGRVYGGSLKGISSPNLDIEECPSVTSNLATSPPEKGRFGSGEWRVYGGRVRHMSSPARSFSLPETQPESTCLPTCPPLPRGEGRFGSTGSGEWRVYGGNAACLSLTDRVNANDNQALSLLSGPRLSSSRLSSNGVVRRSRSVGSGGKLSSSGSGDCKPVYNSASGRRSSAGSAGGGRTLCSQRAASPGGRTSVSGGSGDWLNSFTTGWNRISSAGSQGSGSEGSRAGGRVRSTSGSGRTNNSTGGRVISSSDRPIRSTGSGTGGNKERISVCKMAALKISEVGRERSQERRKQQQQQQHKAAVSSPLHLTSGGGVTSVSPDNRDDITRL
ncbi:uncharacterized protein LOC131475728 [Solea solea]|uniref:uncharacterized protein LOC131475728 n=1 Tax=Solea solea TaxID=90069 RepID=UPI00272A201D|nr:uncharacterized protein LOC131475728 [Solea solea]